MKGRLLLGLVLAIAACATFASVDTASQVVVRAGVPVLLAAWVRFCIQALATTALGATLRGRSLLQTRRVGLQMARGAVLVAGSTLLFASLKFVPVGEMTAIMMLAPMAVTAAAGLLFKEHVPPLRWMLLAGGFGGTLFIIRPGADDFTWAMLLPLGQVFFNTLFQLLTSRLSHTEDPVTTNLYTSLAGVVLLSPALALANLDQIPGWAWIVLLGMGLGASMGHMLWAMAFQRVPATQIMPFTYAQIAFAVLAGWVAIGAMPDRWAVTGMAVIALCGIGSALLTLRQQRR